VGWVLLLPPPLPHPPPLRHELLLAGCLLLLVLLHAAAHSGTHALHLQVAAVGQVAPLLRGLLLLLLLHLHVALAAWLPLLAQKVLPSLTALWLQLAQCWGQHLC
jgi:hypothetical protein